MTGFMVVFFLILSALSIVVVFTRDMPARQQPTPKRVLRRRAAPTTNPTRPASLCTECHTSQRRIRQIQYEQQMLVALWLFMLAQPTPPAPDV